MNRTRAEEPAERNLIESLWWALALGLTVILDAQIYNGVSWENYKEAQALVNVRVRHAPAAGRSHENSSSCTAL